MHFEVLLDLGFDYGADGGLFWDTQVINYPGGNSRRNQRRSAARGQWQLGSRNVDAPTLQYLTDFMHAMRGRLHTFLYRDWNDYEASNQAIVIDGTSTSQVTKTYGQGVNEWVRPIRKPDPATVTFEYDQGGGFAALTEGVDYTVDATTGVVTWLLAPLPNSPNAMRWSGEFRVPVRFDRDVLSAQFLGYEQRESGSERAYAIGDLLVYEDEDV